MSLLSMLPIDRGGDTDLSVGGASSESDSEQYSLGRWLITAADIGRPRIESSPATRRPHVLSRSRCNPG